VRGWQHFPHTGDLGIRGYGASLAEAFEQAALALTAAVSDPSTISALVPIAVRCEAPDLELLLVEWLNALIYEMATRRMLFARFEVKVEEGKLEGTAWGEPIDPERHRPAVEVKGATLTALRVAHLDEGGFVAQCVIDV
jgi:SHS2 domain-containing protein